MSSPLHSPIFHHSNKLLHLYADIFPTAFFNQCSSFKLKRPHFTSIQNQACYEQLRCGSGCEFWNTQFRWNEIPHRTAANLHKQPEKPAVVPTSWFTYDNLHPTRTRYISISNTAALVWSSVWHFRGRPDWDVYGRTCGGCYPPGRAVDRDWCKSSSPGTATRYMHRPEGQNPRQLIDP